MTDIREPAPPRNLRAIRAALARLEDENRAARGELHHVLSSKALRLLLVIGHPAWTIRAAASWFTDRTPLRAMSELWRSYRFHRVVLSSFEPVSELNAEATAWRNPELRISGKRREGLLCDGDSVMTFRSSIGRRAWLRTHCAVLPQGWDLSPAGLEFRVEVEDGSDTGPTWTRTALRTMDPAARWADRRWRAIGLQLPPDSEGEVVVRVGARTPAGARPSITPTAWGDLTLEWPRTSDDRRRLLRGAIRRLGQSGAQGTVQYALGRQHLEDQAAAYTRWIQTHRLNDRALVDLRAQVATLSYQPLISVLTPVHNTEPRILEACIESVRRQAYVRWELCVADDGSTSEGTRRTLRQAADDQRVHLVTLAVTANVSAASNAALKIATGEYVALLDHDDELAPEALAEVVRYLDAHPDADVIYSDEDKLDESGAHCDPYFKPDWSPELFLSYMYTCHLMVVRRRLIEEVGGFRVGFEGAQDYDLMLRLMERTDRIHHIPKVLYHWRKTAASTATLGTIKPWALEAGLRALDDYARRTGSPAEVVHGPLPGMYQFRRAIRGEPLVSIVIPTTGRPHGAGDLLAQCLRSLAKTTWANFEVVIASDSGEFSAAVLEALRSLRHTVVEYQPRQPFNFSHKMNLAVRRSSGEHVVLFNDDLEVISPDWLKAMLAYSQEPGVGAVGAKLLYPDGRLQHVGVLIGVCGLAGHAFHRSPAGSPGYAGSAIVARNYSAVTAACLMTRRAVFDQVGGLDEDLPVDFNDVDFCLRLRASGYRIVFTPQAELVHHESASFGRRVQSAQELARMRQRWGPVLETDPYYNSNLSKHFSDYRLQP